MSLDTLALAARSDRRVRSTVLLRFEQAKFIITHVDLKDVALDAADQVGIQRKHVYTLGKTEAPTLKSVKYVGRCLGSGGTVAPSLGG